MTSDAAVTGIVSFREDGRLGDFIGVGGLDVGFSKLDGSSFGRDNDWTRAILILSIHKFFSCQSDERGDKPNER